MSKQKNIRTNIGIALAAAGMLALTACGGTDIVLLPSKPAGSPTPVASTLTVDFSAGIDGWSTGVADYTDGTEPTEVAASWKDLPAPLTGKGYYLISHNNSDDVLTYAKRQVGGFVPCAKYALTFEMRFATDAAAGCFGVGGSRGDSVYLVAAASADEPKTLKQADGNYRLNLERGNQAESGRQGKVLGTQGVDGLDCNGGKWASATRKSSEAIELQADKDGKFWIVLGTDSAFESTNALYLQGATINVKPI
ncbi:hypothetical protein [Duganella sp. LjRoot269]|uniref:hypothetical protein n=1 Tax=Duganella sp. LjRoot269 TaxID=3342305 RepID=UPI003ECF331C